jgi:hypothetical protein
MRGPKPSAGRRPSPEGGVQNDERSGTRGVRSGHAAAEELLRGYVAGSGGPPGERNGQYRHGDRTKAAIAEQRKFSALLKMLRAGLT